MIASELEAILQDYAREHLSPKTAERAEISRKYNQLKDFLQQRTFQNGSYARHTSTTPVNDLDVIYELPDEVRESVRIAKAAIDPSKLDIKDIIASLAKELQKFYGTSATIKPQPHSVGIYFGSEEDFSIDVVPALSADNGMYWVPETAHLSVRKRRRLYESKQYSPILNWIKSDPNGYISQASQLDKTTVGRFRKSAKIIKKWRWRWKQENDEFPLKSFHLELVVTDIFRQDPNQFCFDVIKAFIESIPSIISKPQCSDRADSSRYIDDYIKDLTDKQKKVVRAAAAVSNKEIAAFANANSKQDAETELRSFLGVSQKLGIVSNVSSAVAGIPGSARKLILKGIKPVSGREAGEQFLTDLNISTDLRFDVKINAKVTQDGFRPFKLLGTIFPLKKYRSLEFFVESCSVPPPYQIKWKVKNTGAEALRVGQLRGQIYDDDGQQRRSESTKYWGNHYVECYVIKDGICVAADHVDVDIGKE